jgi:hypothetical protein
MGHATVAVQVQEEALRLDYTRVLLDVALWPDTATAIQALTMLINGTIRYLRLYGFVLDLYNWKMHTRSTKCCFFNE